jgi:hypothetical protein
MNKKTQNNHQVMKALPSEDESEAITILQYSIYQVTSYFNKIIDMWPLKAQLRRSTAVLLQDPVIKSLTHHITSHHITLSTLAKNKIHRT